MSYTYNSNDYCLQSLHDALDNIYDALVPGVWRKGSWASTTLGFWFTEFLDRDMQFRTWCFGGRPICFWMSGFFNPQGWFHLFIVSLRIFDQYNKVNRKFLHSYVKKSHELESLSSSISLE